MADKYAVPQGKPLKVYDLTTYGSAAADVVSKAFSFLGKAFQRNKQPQTINDLWTIDSAPKQQPPQTSGLRRLVAFFSQALVYAHGNDTIVFPWDEISVFESTAASKHQLIVRGVPILTCSCTIRNDAGEVVELGYQCTDEWFVAFVDQLKSEVLKHRLPASMIFIAAGNTVVFGHCMIANDGVSNGQEILAWDKVFMIHDNWFEPRELVPNLFVLRALIKHMVAQQNKS